MCEWVKVHCVVFVCTQAPNICPTVQKSAIWVIASYESRDEYEIVAAALLKTVCCMNVRCLISLTPAAWWLAHLPTPCPAVDLKWQVRNTPFSRTDLSEVWAFTGHMWARWHASSGRGQTLTSLSACQAVFTGHRWKHARVKADSYLLLCRLILVHWRRSHVIFLGSPPGEMLL